MNNVLIVEDDWKLASLLAEVLVDAGFHAQCASDVDDAEDIVAREAIDAAILDIRVGETSSFALARVLNARDIPYLFASSVRRIDIPQDLRWQPLIGKPYTAEQVVTALRALCGRIYSGNGAPPSENRNGRHPAI